MKPKEKPAAIELPDGTPAPAGLLHCYKKDDKWHFVSESELSAKKDSLPTISFAFKTPIRDLDSKEWPDLDKLLGEIGEADGDAKTHGEKSTLSNKEIP